MLTVEICTKDRYDSLAFCLQSICNQTYTPKELIIFDDSQNKFDLRQSSAYLNLFKLMDRKKIKWKVEFSPCHGQVKNHIKATEMCETEFLYRCDDDHVLEHNVLETLFNSIINNKEVGAVCNTILHPDTEFEISCTSPKMEDCLFKYAANFTSHDSILEVEHIYSSFLSRVEAIKGCYPTCLSEVNHREETICSHNIFRKGYKLLCHGNVFTWHMKNSTGGIRSYNDPKKWEHDEGYFYHYLAENKIKIQDYFLMINNGGIGDNYIFRKILPLIRKKHEGKKLILGTVYPDVYFDEPDIELISIHSANILAKGDSAKFDFYKYAWDNDLECPAEEIYKKIYGV